jgi:F-type H+-transporting ATPase subunit epsilon
MPIPSHLALEIVTPERSILHDKVDEVEIPGSDGYFGVLPGHAPLLASLQVGQLWYRKGGETSYLSVAFGFAEVLPDRVTILARIAERAEEIDIDRAQKERQRAEDELARRAADVDLERARISLLKALTRLRVANRARTRV